MGASASRPVITVAAVVVALGLLSLVLPSSATYDAWSWIVWGREVIHGDLNTVNGPSWKPLPVVVTSLAAPLGSVAPDVWIVVARIGAISGVVLAFVLARRIGGPAAGLLAGASLAAAPWWVWNGWLANSEGLLVALVLGTILAHLDGHRRIALAGAIGAALLRPEAWPFLLLYAAWLFWRTDLRGRIALAAGLAIVPLAWLLPEKWGSGDYWRAATRAQNPDPGAASLTAQPAWTVTKDFFVMLPSGVWVVVAAAVLVAAVTLVQRLRGPGEGPTSATASPGPDPAPAAPSRTHPAPATGPDPAPGAPTPAPPDAERPLLVLAFVAALGVAWLAVVVVLTLRGFSGNERYLIPPVALMLVAASAGVGRLLPHLPRIVQAVLVVGATVAVGVAAAQDVPEQTKRAFYESRLIDALPVAIDRAGGADRIRDCAPVATHKFMVPQAAWYLRQHIDDVRMVPTGPDQLVLRLRLQEGGGWTPTVRQIPDLSTWTETPYWQIVAHCGPSTGSTR